ncbi:Cthe_2314 family HEPN domain-containing protein [Mucilaginibacter sp. PAMB04168]|uniref:Cthe_2314 family HEPN domain-containing protein n=1 Tax=Mucilaginibacter sp. PAMB04168 TaxID=3138567 RepID=UPI0031F6C935
MVNQFSQNIALLAVDVLKLDEIKKPSLGFNPSRSLYPHEEYIQRSLLAIGEVDGLVRQLNYSAILLANFRNTPTMKRNKISRYEYMIYHIEGYLLRVTGVLDRLLKLVNTILDLKLNDNACIASMMIHSRKGVKGLHNDRIETMVPGLTNALLEISRYIEKFREDRNMIAHKGKIHYQDLREIEMFHIVLQNDPEEEIKKFEWYIKILTDKKVVEYKKDFQNCTETIESLLLPIYTLLEVFFNNYQKSLRTTI